MRQHRFFFIATLTAKTFGASGLILAASLLSACGGGGGGGDLANPATSGTFSVAARTSELPPNDPDCPAGGILVETGIDKNGNGQLDPDEVQNTKKVCHGSDGLASLINTSDEPPGSNCPYGGQRIDTGLDTNRDGILVDSEITRTSYVCNPASLATQGRWTNFDLISSFNGMLYTPAVAYSQSGRAAVLYTKISPAGGTGGQASYNFSLWASIYDPALGGWSRPAPLSDPPPPLPNPVTERAMGRSEKALATNANGDFVVVWIEGDASTNGATGRLMASFNVPGTTTWSEPVVVTNTVDTYTYPTVTMHADGNVTIAWTESSNGQEQLVVRSSFTQTLTIPSPVPGGSPTTITVRSWRDPLTITQTGRVLLPTLSMAADGSITIVWEENDGTGNRRLMFTRYQPESNPPSYDAPTEIGKLANRFGWNPNFVVGMSPGGWIAAAYLEPAVGKLDSALRVRIYNPGKLQWDAATDLAPVRADSYQPHAIAINDQGIAMLLSRKRMPDAMAYPVPPNIPPADRYIYYDLFASRYTPATGWSEFERLEFSPADVDLARIGIDTNGNAIAVWTHSALQPSLFPDREQTFKRYVYLVTRRYVENLGGWQNAETLLSYTTDATSENFPYLMDATLASDETDNFLLVASYSRFDILDPYAGRLFFGAFWQP